MFRHTIKRTPDQYIYMAYSKNETARKILHLLSKCVEAQQLDQLEPKRTFKKIFMEIPEKEWILMEPRMEPTERDHPLVVHSNADNGQELNGILYVF